MYRLRSTDVFWNAPGIVACYQPISAPDSLAARQNVGNDLRMAGRHTAQPGVLPTHDPRTGWRFVAASSQYLNTGAAPSAGWSMLLRYSGLPGIGSGVLMGTRGDPRMYFYPAAAGQLQFAYGNNQYLHSASPTSAVLGLTANLAYLDGGYLGAGAGTWSGGPPKQIAIGGLQRETGVVDLFVTTNIQAVAISAITLTPAHVAQYSRQMAYCHVNPDWSAWGRRRRYYYAPSAAVVAFQAAWAARANRLLSGGVDRV